MRYRIQISPMLDCTLVTVTSIEEWRGSVTHQTKMYTLDHEVAMHGGLVEVLGFLQEQIAASTP